MKRTQLIGIVVFFAAIALYLGKSYFSYADIEQVDCLPWIRGGVICIPHLPGRAHEVVRPVYDGTTVSQLDVVMLQQEIRMVFVDDRGDVWIEKLDRIQGHSSYYGIPDGGRADGVVVAYLVLRLRASPDLKPSHLDLRRKRK